MKAPLETAAPADIVNYIDQLEDECYRDPNRAAWHRSKQRWMDLYTGNHFADPLVSSYSSAQSLEPEQLSNAHRASTICKLVYNRVQNAILAMLAGQISNPPKVVFGARESGEPPIYYLNGFVQNPQLQQIAMLAGQNDPQVQQEAAMYPPGHPQPMQSAVQAGQSIPLPPELVDQVKALIDQGKMMTAQARLAGMPPPLGIVPPEALVEITDQTTAQFTQTVYEGLWEQCGGVEAVTENILNKKVLGWQPTLVETDRSKIDSGESPITLTNMEGTQVFYDPMTSSFRPPRYAIMKEPVSYEEAVAKYPDLDIAGTLKDKFRSGNLNYRSRDGTQSGRLFYLQYGRDMGVVRTCWMRDWAYPMDPDEAMTKGLVQIGQVPDESGIGSSARMSGAGNAEVQPQGSQPDQPQPSSQDSPYGSGQTPTSQNGDNVLDQRPVAPPTRQAFIHSDTGQEVTPNHPAWPIIYGIREICDIEGEIVWDRRCKKPIIPIPNDVNIPIPFSPYGYGEPDRLDGLQMAINRVLSDMVTHHRYNTYPPEVAHQSVVQQSEGEIRKLRMQPGQVISVPESIAQQLGGDLSKLVQYVETPQMSGDAWKLLEFLVEAIDKEANNNDVQQGAAPSGSSGAWVANLQAAANQVAQVTSQATEAWLKQVVRLIVHFITHDMTTQDVQKYCSKYPPAILDAFHRRQKALYLDIAVDIQSGSGAAKQGQNQALMAAKQSGVPISDPEIMNRLGVDPDDQLTQQANWQQKLTESGLLEQQAEQQAVGAANNGEKDKGQVNAA